MMISFCFPYIIISVESDLFLIFFFVGGLLEGCHAVFNPEGPQSTCTSWRTS